VDAFRKLVQQNPNFLPAHAYLAALFTEMGRHEEAEAAWRQAQQLSPGAPPWPVSGSVSLTGGRPISTGFSRRRVGPGSSSRRPVRQPTKAVIPAWSVSAHGPGGLR
jgi:tetratricopeptide (TPR) repeat protein